MSHRSFPYGPLFLLLSLAIIAVTTWYSTRLAAQLAAEEQKKMELWAEAIRQLAEEKDDATFDYTLTLRIIEENTNIPVVLCDDQGVCLSHSNLRLRDKNSTAEVDAKVAALKAHQNVIEVKLSETISQYVYYDESRLLRQLRYFPIVQLGVMFLFLVVVAVSIILSKRAEQDRVWAGLSKETAHQLGTPISSLTAWLEILKLKDIDEATLAEMAKDTERLRTIADRFSKIGSKPDPLPCDLLPVVRRSLDYMQGRVSKRVSFRLEVPSGEETFQVNLNEPLFAWVIENLCRNAVDAMEGDGCITVSVAGEGRTVNMDVSDTGKGIARKHFRDVFRPGYTTKQRGWGLGLSLSRRIVEEYHRGRIFVLRSEMGHGTTFRIVLNRLNR